MEILIGFSIWVSLCIVAGVIANNKGRHGPGFFFLSLLLSPLIGIIAALVVKKNTSVVETEQISKKESKKCPHCAEMIKYEAKVCRYCGKDIT